MALEGAIEMRSVVAVGGIVLAALSTFACDRASVAGPRLPSLFDEPVRHVSVIADAHYVFPGDTTILSAGAYDSSGRWTKPNSAATWELSDATTGVLTWFGPGQRGARFAGLRAGRTLVIATIEGIRGNDTVWIVPRSVTVHFAPKTASLTVGDTLFASVWATDTSSWTFPWNRVRWERDNLNLRFDGYWPGRGLILVATAAGTTRIVASLLTITDTAVVTIAPKP